MASQHNNDHVHQAGDLERTRATPLRPMVWMTSVLAWASVVALAVRVSRWGSIFLCALTGISFLSVLISYIYLFMNDREVLRAERWRERPATMREVPANQQAELSAHPPTYLASERAATTVASLSEGVGAEKVSIGKTTRMKTEDR